MVFFFRLGFDDFRLYHYGPFSADLADVLDSAKQYGLLSEMPGKPWVAADGTEVTPRSYQVPGDARDIAERVTARRLPGRAGEFAGLVGRLAKCDRRVLEVAATAAYVRRPEQSLTDGSLWRQVRQVKPKLTSSVTKAKGLLAELPLQ